MKRFLAPLSRIAEWEPPIPRQHLYAILMLAGFSVASVTLLPSPNELLPDSRIAVRQIANDDANTAPSINRKNSADQSSVATEFVNIPDHELVGNEANPVDGLDNDSDSEPQWVNYQVKGDDNLSVIFNTMNLPAKTLHKLLEVDIQNSLIRLKIDQTISFQVDGDNVLQRLAIPLDNNRRVLFERNADNYTSRIEAISSDDAIAQNSVDATTDDEDSDTPAAKVQADSKVAANTKPDIKAETKKAEAKPVPKSRVITGTVNGAFVVSAKNAGLSNNQIHRVANMFRGRIDFRRDLHKGDTFRVLFDKPHGDDAKILAVSFKIRGRDMSAYLNNDGQFYDEHASNFSSSGTFMRFPIPSQRKVSSGFSPNRKNPVTGRVQPHNGTDFAVPVGTPILAVADGVIVKATSHPDAGRYVIIRHGGVYSTTYMHMSKLLVKPGDKIKQGQKIGLSGNTGRSTGPHLHFEFRISNRPVDAMRVDLPMNKGMPDNSKRQFLAKVREYKRLMSQG